MSNRKTTLGGLVESFFRSTLGNQRCASPQTIASYRDALKMFFVFAANQKKCNPSLLSVDDLDADMVLAFLNDLETNRHNSTRTRNGRRTALRSFFRHVAFEDPTALGIVERIMLIPAKNCAQKGIDYLRPREQDAVLSAPDQRTKLGRRDYALIMFLLKTGARESEAIAVDLEHLRLVSPRQVLLFGKGRKQRIVPICESTTAALNRILADRPLHDNQCIPVFVSRRGSRLTRHGVIHIVRRAAAIAAECEPSLAKRSISPHLLRHTCGMELLRAGVDLTTIRSWLGHVSLQTTHEYVEADVEMKRKALECCPLTVDAVRPFTAPDPLLNLLENL